MAIDPDALAGSLRRLEDLRAELERYRRDGLTDKNLALIRQVLSEGAPRAGAGVEVLERAIAATRVPAAQASGLAA